MESIDLIEELAEIVNNDDFDESNFMYEHELLIDNMLMHKLFDKLELDTLVE